MISSPEPDTYGQYARASLLADYVELLALNGLPVSRATVADFLSDSEWNLELIIPAENDTHFSEQGNSISDRLAESEEAASIVFRQLDERSHILADLYPFEITNDLVSLGHNVDREGNAYVAVLALTIAHAFEVASVAQPETLFERTVTAVMRSRRLLSVGVATARREYGSFERALIAACQRVDLLAAPNAAPRLANAYDEKVDVLCHFSWEQDLRPGTWGFIGQVTVGRSDSWESKIKEPNPSTWALFTGTRIPLLPFLAVPHHVERQMMEKLTVDAQAVVLDRLRLVRFKPENDDDEREVIQAVLQEKVEPLIG